MRDYVIINGVNSLTINGLAISKLPPISKPLMRNMKEEIDGRDGDIITELGYSAYDKTMEIGLYGNFDINEVISFFNGEGTITFSNEDDKHYYFKILEQIDYEKLLKFKTATITFHCQPFKYPNNEQIIDVDSLTVEGTGTDITLANTSLYAPISTELLGDTIQDGIPTPINVDTVEGEQEIIISNKNLFNFDTFTDTSSGLTSTISGNNLKITGTATTTQKFLTNYIDNNFKVGSYVFSITKVLTARLMIRFFDSNNATISTYNIMPGETSVSLQLNGTEKKYRLIFNPVVNQAYNVDVNIQLEHGTVSTSYEEFQEQSYEINLGKNLFDKDTMTTRIYSYIKDATTWAVATGGYSIRIPCKPNTNYTISANNPNETVFRAGATDSNDIPATGITITLYSVSRYTNTNLPIYITTGANAKYIVIQVGEGTASDTFNTLQVEKGSEQTSYSSYKTPIELCKIGDYQDSIKKGTGKNLFGFNITAFDKTTTYRVNVNQRLAIEGTSNPNECKFTFGSGSYCRGYFEIEGINGLLPYSISFNVKENTTSFIPSYTIETSSCNENRLVFYINGGNGSTTVSTSNYFILTNIQVELGNQSATFEPYGTSGKWLLHKEIGKVVLDGSESIERVGMNISGVYRFSISAPTDIKKNGDQYALANLLMSNKFYEISNYVSFRESVNGILVRTNNTNNFIINCIETQTYSVAEFKTWLQNNNVIVYYVLEIPSTTEITDTELLAQLNLLSNATTYDEATNILSTGDLPSIFNVSATSIPTTTITNIGNIYAKPLLTIKGRGDISVYLNGIQLLQIALGDREEITIDVSKMEAYDEETKVLLNRLVIGDYSKFLINSGVNELLITGDVSNFTMSNYTRWL